MIDDKDMHGESLEIGEISNYYGGLHLCLRDGGGYAWSIENYSGNDWEEIPAYLGEALLRFQQERAK